MNKMKKNIIFLISIFLVLGLFSAGYYFNKNRSHGETIIPKAVVPVSNMDSIYFLQRDSKWENVKIGSSTQTLGQSGCLICSVACSLNKLGYKTNPTDLNEKLINVNGFEGASLIWYKLSEIYPKITYKYTRAIDVEDIQKYLDKGNLPIVKVKYKGVGIYHWVLIIGSTNDDFLIYDPLEPTQKPIPLKTHGKIYSYSVLFKK